MNRNHMLKRKMTAGLAVGMAVAVGSVPMAMAANTANTTDSSSSVSKEETVYVNADASGNPQQITVSNWLKNAGSESSVEDQSDLTNIKNVKGDETFSENGDSLTWNTDGSDIYYQGQSNKDLPVSVKFTYFLDGQEMQPQDLVGKSGHLQIKIQYTNNEKKSAKVDGKNETIYSPFVMLTAMILPDDTFSNVTIDNGKVISDGSRNIVVGVGMPGLKDSLKLDTLSLSTDDEDKNSEDKTLDIDIPDSVSIEADVTDFSMSSSLTVALSDILKDIDFNDDGALDDIKDALDELTDAATQLVDGTSDLYDGVEELDEKYGEFDDGVKELRDGTHDLADGVTAYVAGEQQLSQGAQALTQIQGAINTLYAAVDGEGETTEDLLAASNALAQGTATLKASLGTEETQQLMALLDNMLTTGNDLIAEAGGLSSVMKEQIVAPVQGMMANAEYLMNQITAVQSYTVELAKTAATAKDTINAQIANANTELSSAAQGLADSVNNAANAQINNANTQIANANAQIDSARAVLQQQLDAANAAGNTELAASLQTAINSLGNVSGVEAVNVDAPAYTPVQGIDGMTLPTLNADLEGMAAKVESIKNTFDTLQTTVTGLITSLTDVQTKIDSITSMKDQIPAADITALSTGVDLLDSNMQDFNAEMGNLSTQVATLNTQASAGIKQLLDGFAQLDANNETLTGGAAQLKANSASLTSGAAALQTGAGQLIEGLNQLSTQMMAGAGQLAANSQTLRDGAATLKGGIDSAKNGIDTLKSGTDTLKGGTDTLKTGADTLKSGAGTLQSGINTLKSGTSALSSGADTLKSGTNDLRKGTLDLKSGAQTLADGVSDLKDGADTLSDASDDVVDGISELKDGAEDLKDGMQEFYDEGISKIKDLADENLTVILDRLKALTSDEISYDTYSGRSDSMNGSVKFIIETDEIE